jgi:phosphate transport system protein
MTDPKVRRRFHTELDLLQSELQRMAGLAEDLVERAVEAFLSRDPEAVKSIREVDAQIDAIEIDLDGRVMELIALHQPVASDLRHIITVQKICNDVERVGDHALNISKAARRLADLPPLPDTPELAELAVLARLMLRDALASFGSRNPALARKVCTRDDRVDEMKKSVDGLIVKAMLDDPGRIVSALQYLRVSQQLERIGDLSTNIAEDVVFFVEGRSIKHNAERKDDPVSVA